MRVMNKIGNLDNTEVTTSPILRTCSDKGNLLDMKEKRVIFADFELPYFNIDQSSFQTRKRMWASTVIQNIRKKRGSYVYLYRNICILKIPLKIGYAGLR